MGVDILKINLFKVNGTPIEIEGGGKEYPVSPLVYVEDSLDLKGVYKIRISVYVPSEIMDPPSFCCNYDGNPQGIVVEGGKKVIARSFSLKYSYTSETKAKNYNLWHVYVEYKIDVMKSVDYIVTYLVACLENTDPKTTTSRGTVTTVQSSQIGS